MIALIVAGCSNDVALGGPNTLVRVDGEPPGVNCPNGGVAVHTGLDHDGDGYLDDDEITSTQYVCNGSEPVQCGGGTIVNGTVAIEQSSDFALLDGATCVDGDLLIAGVPDNEIPALDLETVTGGVVVVGNQNLTSIDGLGHLREIGGTYLVQGNPALANVHGMSAITRAQQISIVGNDALPDLTGLEGLKDTRIQLTISNNGSLASLTGLDNLTTASQQITIHSNHDLTSLDGLRNLRSVALIEVSGNETLPAVEFPALEQIGGRLLVNNNVAVTTVTMPALTTLGDFLQVDGNAALTAVSMPELLTIASILIDNDNSITTFSAPKLLFATNVITLFTLPKLSQLQVPHLTSIGGTLTMNTTPAFANFSAFSTVTTIGGSLIVQNNTGIHNFTGFTALRLISGDMTVVNNASLSSYVGLEQLGEIGGSFKASQNPMLPAATSQAFADRVGVGGTITIN
ncbi:MAG TPA: hypothetical protein VGO00_20735 [Kofleriaceae bacterium]|nr:hypothetical protein [Kofleriaceae bacterium]